MKTGAMPDFPEVFLFCFSLGAYFYWDLCQYFMFETK